MPYTLTPKPKSAVEITFSIPWEELSPHIERAAKTIGKGVKLDGFRPGKVPVDVVRQKFSDLEILQQQLDGIVGYLYYEAVKTEKLFTLGRPEISVLKLADGNPFEFKATTALVPNVKPVHFRGLAVETKTVEVTETDVERSLGELRKMRAEKDRPLPEVNDEFAKSLGNFQTLEELRKKILENLTAEREYEESVRQENALIDLLIEKSEFEELPEILLESELEQVFHEFKQNVERNGVSFSDWLSKIKKTESTFKTSLTPQAEKRAKSSLLLRTIAEQEGIEPSEEEVKEEIASLFRQYPDPKQQEELLKPEFTDYFRRVIVSKKTIQFLKGIMIKNP